MISLNRNENEDDDETIYQNKKKQNSKRNK